MMTFKELREQSGMNMKRFAEYFGIPYRTVQNWEAGVNKCPEYLLKLMKFRLDHEKCNVITESGLIVFSGNKTQCNAYLKQALKKGSAPGFLRIERGGENAVD